MFSRHKCREAATLFGRRSSAWNVSVIFLSFCHALQNIDKLPKVECPVLVMHVSEEEQGSDAGGTWSCVLVVLACPPCMAVSLWW